ncbi:MAG: hypothetical protein NC311_01435 [Muribaculaceae bacterium]|nr:hypothetical protein [Muribaculaceae bacterium]
MKPKIITLAMCIAFAIPINAHAEVSGYVQNHMYNGTYYWFTSTYDDNNEVGWEYHCENGFEDMERNFDYVEIWYDESTEDKRDGYSYVKDCEVIGRTCLSTQYIYENWRDDGSFIEYACADCPTAPDGTKGRSWCNYWTYWVGFGSECSNPGITTCFVTSGKDTTGTYKYTSNCYYKQ